MKALFYSLTIFLFVFTSCAKQKDIYGDLLNRKADGTLSLKGNIANVQLDIENNKAFGILNSDYISIHFNQNDDQLVSTGNIDGIELNELTESKLGNFDTLFVSEGPSSDNEINVELDIAHACGGPVAESGKVIVDKYDELSISGKIELRFSNNDSLQGFFNVPLWNNKPEIPKEYRLLSDSYPDSLLNFGEITLSGEVKGIKINDKCEGKISLNKLTFEIDAYTNTVLKKIEIECFSPGIDKKIAHNTTFKLIPMREETGLFAKLKSLIYTNTFFAEWEDYHPDNPVGEDSPVKGTFVINTIAQNGISGEYEIKIIEKDGTFGNVKGKFKLPIK